MVSPIIRRRVVFPDAVRGYERYPFRWAPNIFRIATRATTCNPPPLEEWAQDGLRAHRIYNIFSVGLFYSGSYYGIFTDCHIRRGFSSLIAVASR